MEFLATLFAWVMAHGAEIVAVLVALHAAAAVIVNLTPTPVDDAILGKVYKLIEFLAGVVSKRAKDLPGETPIREEIEAEVAAEPKE